MFNARIRSPIAVRVPGGAGVLAGCSRGPRRADRRRIAHSILRGALH
jgi:hypothetical protein